VLANQDSFLPFALAEDGGGDARQLVALFEAVDQDGRGVGNFLRGELQDLFADEFGGEEALWLVGDLVFQKVARAFGQSLDDCIEESVEAVLLQRRDGNDVDEFVQILVMIDQR